MAYILEIKQIVDYPRVRIHRELIQKLLADESLSDNGSSHLFRFMVLCSYANFRSSYKRIDGTPHLVGPGEWICELKEIAGWFGCRRLTKARAILDELSEMGFVGYETFHRGRWIRYRILNWEKFNTVLEYECRCQKDCGFFFFPISYGTQLMEGRRCSEKDILLDLWLNTIYRDDRVKGSDLGPVVYLRNGTGDPLTSCSILAERWGRSRTTACRILRKLSQSGYIHVLSFPGRHGTVIYLENYLSVMFQTADLPIDKEEVALRLCLNVEAKASGQEPCVSNGKISVSKPVIRRAMPKVLQTLMAQGFFCCGCRKKAAKLYPLSGACDLWILEIRCKHSKYTDARYRFELRVFNNSG